MVEITIYRSYVMVTSTQRWRLAAVTLRTSDSVTPSLCGEWRESGRHPRPLRTVERITVVQLCNGVFASNFPKVKAKQWN